MRLIRQKSGAFSVYHPRFKQTMHPGDGPWHEATNLYVKGSGLLGLLHASPTFGASPAFKNAPEVVVFDIGLGAAANALAALSLHRTQAQQTTTKPLRPLRVVSFERDLSALHFALKNAETLGYLKGWEESVGLLLRHGRVDLQHHGQSNHKPPIKAVWELREGDCAQCLDQETLRAQVVFFDPFSREVNEEMWRLQIFQALRHCATMGEGIRLVTYSKAAPVQAGLLAANFFVGYVQMAQHQILGSIAASAQPLIKTPLSPKWLLHWKKNKRPLPPQIPHRLWGKWQQAVLEHPQWEFEDLDAPPNQAPKPTKKVVYVKPWQQQGSRDTRDKTKHGGATRRHRNVRLDDEENNRSKEAQSGKTALGGKGGQSGKAGIYSGGVVAKKKALSRRRRRSSTW